MRHWLLLGILMLGIATEALGTEWDWAKDMFDKTSHNFGVVARGAEVKKTFTIENIYVEDAHISLIRSSCGCANPKLSKNYLKTWEKAELTTEIDTRKFLGRKDTTITVKFDLPFPAEVQLHLYTYIRSDVVVQPGVVQFGTVDAGAAPRQKVAVSYAGRDDWQITQVESPNPFLKAQAVEKYRGNGKVGYDLMVSLDPSAPSGYLREQIYLVTNDSNSRAARVPVAVEGLIASQMTVRPNPLFLGVVEAGQNVSRCLFIQSKTPFRVLSIHTSDQRLRCKVPQEAKPLHLLPITLIAPPTEGRFSGLLRIETDQDRVGPLDVQVDAQVTPPKESQERGEIMEGRKEL